MAARLKDIAAKLNVSISTVSYALNGGPRPVPEEVRQRIVETARELGYRPNRLAKSLASRRTMTIGVLPTVVTRGLTVVPYFQACFSGIVDQSELTGYDVLLYTQDAPHEIERQADMLLDGRVDGVIILAPLMGSPLLGLIRNEGLPCAVVFGDVNGPVPCITADNKTGTRRAVKHLVELGHRRIANIHGGSASLDGAERLEAFLEAMAEHGLDVRPEWLEFGEMTPFGGYDSARKLLTGSERPTAIVCANDENAVGVYRAAADLGFRIPVDLSVIGFDDAPAAQILLPHLTTIRQPMERMGAAAMSAVVDLIKVRRPASQRFDTELVVRDSTYRPPEVK